MAMETKTKRYGSNSVTVSVSVLIVVLVIAFIIRGLTSRSTSSSDSTMGTAQSTYAYTNQLSSTSVAPSTDSAAITNPNYIANPSAYLVDADGQVSSTIPFNQPLWVEKVIDPATIEVSYVINQSGSNIIESKELAIPGLGWPAAYSAGDPIFSLQSLQDPVPNRSCWASAILPYLSQNVLHHYVYLTSASVPDPVAYSGQDDGYRLLFEGNERSHADIAQLAVRSGYGLALASSTSPYNYADKSSLHSDQQVASLAKRGAWGTCN